MQYGACIATRAMSDRPHPAARAPRRVAGAARASRLTDRSEAGRAAGRAVEAGGAHRAADLTVVPAETEWPEPGVAAHRSVETHPPGAADLTVVPAEAERSEAGVATHRPVETRSPCAADLAVVSAQTDGTEHRRVRAAR